MVDKALIEAALFVAGERISLAELGELCGCADLKEVKTAVEELMGEYKARGSGIEIFKSGSGYGMGLRRDLEEKVVHLIPETDMPKAMLKTLALIAYEQPIKQSYVVKVRGNRAYYYIKRLAELEFIEGRQQGHTKLLSTTGKFNKYFHINDAKEIIRKDVKEKTEALTRELSEEEKAEEDGGQTKLETEPVEVLPDTSK